MRMPMPRPALRSAHGNCHRSADRLPVRRGGNPQEHRPGDASANGATRKPSLLTGTGAAWRCPRTVRPVLALVLVLAAALPAAAMVSPSAIRSVVASHRDEVRRCYERALRARPGLQGRVTVRFAIAPSGRVRSVHAEASALGRDLESCLEKRISRWRFPAASPSRGEVRISYPFVFAP